MLTKLKARYISVCDAVCVCTTSAVIIIVDYNNILPYFQGESFSYIQNTYNLLFYLKKVSHRRDEKDYKCSS